jgi:hypothetical protein
MTVSITGTEEFTRYRISLDGGYRLAGSEVGGPEGIRTLDLFHAMEARSQLRHRPIRPGVLRPENTISFVLHRDRISFQKKNLRFNFL